jgi:hypothetical protein
MANAENNQRKKGTFTNLRLPVAKTYVYPASRKKIMVIGGLAALAMLGYILFNNLLLGNDFISSGSLSANHANFENNCNACHDSRAVTNEKCSQCHELTGRKPGIYTFAAHYVFRSGNVRRMEAAQKKFAAQEQQCFSCHPEHLGRQTNIAAVADSRCLQCHVGFSFRSAHRDFEFARKKLPDAANLEFTHIDHVTEYVGGKDLNKICLSCHYYEPDGRGFKPISFDLHCQSCHLEKRTDPAHRDRAALFNPRHPCRLCHEIAAGGVIAAVQSDQRILRLAEFDHSAHVLQSQCVDCHNEIPIPPKTGGASTQGKPKIDRSKDKAETQNIPRIDNCVQCHNPKAASDRCVTCHVFHPHKEERFQLGKR